MPPPRRDQGNGPWLDETQAHTWLTFIQIQLRLTYEMNRQLQADSGLSLRDYDVLSALADAPGHRMQLSDLATLIGWEISRLSHHTSRMSRRGLVERLPSATDRRATDLHLTSAGQATLTVAAPAHVALVRRMFFEGLPPDLHQPFQATLESIYHQLISTGTLPPPPFHDSDGDGTVRLE
jgi:DNA-binding MarR family transcriptional regulator